MHPLHALLLSLLLTPTVAVYTILSTASRTRTQWRTMDETRTEYRPMIQTRVITLLAETPVPHTPPAPRSDDSMWIGPLHHRLSPFPRGTLKKWRKETIFPTPRPPRPTPTRTKRLPIPAPRHRLKGSRTRGSPGFTKAAAVAAGIQPRDHMVCEVSAPLAAVTPTSVPLVSDSSGPLPNQSEVEVHIEPRAITRTFPYTVHLTRRCAGRNCDEYIRPGRPPRTRTINGDCRTVPRAPVKRGCADKSCYRMTPGRRPEGTSSKGSIVHTRTVHHSPSLKPLCTGQPGTKYTKKPRYRAVDTMISNGTPQVFTRTAWYGARLRRRCAGKPCYKYTRSAWPSSTSVSICTTNNLKGYSLSP